MFHPIITHIYGNHIKLEVSLHFREIWPTVCRGYITIATVATVSFDWFLSGLEWILNLEFCLLKLLIFYQKLLWNIRSRLNSSTFWVFEPVFRYVWLKLKLFEQKMKILIKHIQRVLALCYFWDLEKVALAKNRISKIFILCTQ